MPTSLVSTGVQFPDSSIQTTAATGAASGVTNTTSAVSITLTSSSNKTQNVTMTAADKAVILPAATTITRLGSDLFTINNTGAYHFYIQLSAGGYINQVAPGGSVTLSLADNTTSDGKWVQSDLGYTAYKMYDYSAFSIPSSLLNTVDGAYATVFVGSVTPLSATTFFITYSTPLTASGFYGVVATLSGTTISYGTPVLIANTIATVIGVLKYSSTTGILVGQPTPPSTVIYIPFSISGTTISAGTQVSSTFTSVSIPNDGQTLSSTLGAVVQYNSAGVATLRAVQYNGLSAPTLGTASATLVNFGANIPVGIAIVSSTTAVLVYNYATTIPYLVGARVASFSGTSAPTLNTATSLGTDVSGILLYTGFNKVNIFNSSGTEYSVTSVSGTLPWQKTFTVSGTTVSSPTNTVSVPSIVGSNVTGCPAETAGPSWINSTTGIYAVPNYNGQPQRYISIKEAKYISGYGWLSGLNMPYPKAFYTPTSINQAAGLWANGVSQSFPKINVLDSSTMLVTTNYNAAPINSNYAITSVIIKPTT